MLKGFITSLTLAVFAAFPVYAQEGISVVLGFALMMALDIAL